MDPFGVLKPVPRSGSARAQLTPERRRKAGREGRSERTNRPWVVVSMAPGLALRTFAIAVAGLLPQNCVFKTDGFSGAGKDKTLGRKLGGFC
jgi:hypothetical protein